MRSLPQESHLIERRPHALAHLRLGCARYHQRQSDIIEYRTIIQQPMVLEDDAE